jgi:hypothetical protein
MTEAVPDAIRDLLLAGDIARVRLDRQHVAELLARGSQRIGAAAGYGDAGALFQHAAGGLEPDAAAAAGDQRRLSVQSAHGMSPFSTGTKMLRGGPAGYQIRTMSCVVPAPQVRSQRPRKPRRARPASAAPSRA